jgi:hypothetical protein
MKLAEIEAELANLSADELHHLTVRMCMEFLNRGQCNVGSNECRQEEEGAAAPDTVGRSDAEGEPGFEKWHSRGDGHAALSQWLTN